jgi:CRISPR-associated protein Csy2
MSQYLVLSHISIQNANCIAGLTWGFPAITHFLGFTHALNRKFSNLYEGDYDSELTGCAVVSHTFQNKVYQPEKFSDFRFSQSKNPPVLEKHKSKSPPIIEEGKMNLTVSLVIELNKALVLTTNDIHKLNKAIISECYQMRIAGGTILDIKNVYIFSASTEAQHIAMLRKIKRLTLPGFVLLDRSNYLREYYQGLLLVDKADNRDSDEPTLLDAWLDFAALKFKAIPDLKPDQSEPDESTSASWEYVPKPYSGYLVPLMTGYKAISKLYEAGAVLNTRDELTPSRYVEAIHSIGEWKGMHRVYSVDEIIWRHEHDGQWYLCKQNCSSAIIDVANRQVQKVEQSQTITFNEALNLF